MDTQTSWFWFLFSGVLSLYLIFIHFWGCEFELSHKHLDYAS